MSPPVPSRPDATAPPLLEVEDLSVGFRQGRGGVVGAVEGVSLSVGRGARVGLVGESGSGKSLTALAIMGLLAGPRVEVRGGVRLVGEDLGAAGPARWRALRGDRLALVFQDPLAALNPSRRVGAQVVEALALRRRMSRAEARREAIQLLERVGMPDAAVRVDAWPHELSGGMRQRACIAMALACGPDLLIADEPTTALDVTVQAQVLDLLGRLQEETGMGVLLISHDLELVAGWCDEVNVMYAGQRVEAGPAARVLTRPAHPYTAGLLGSLPRRGERRARLPELAGRVPELDAMPSGCRFHPRCPHASDRCRTEIPAWRATPGGGVRCHHPLEAQPVEASAAQPLETSELQALGPSGMRGGSAGDARPEVAGPAAGPSGTAMGGGER